MACSLSYKKKGSPKNFRQNVQMYFVLYGGWTRMEKTIAFATWKEKSTRSKKRRINDAQWKEREEKKRMNKSISVNENIHAYVIAQNWKIWMSCFFLLIFSSSFSASFVLNFVVYTFACCLTIQWLFYFCSGIFRELCICVCVCVRVSARKSRNGMSQLAKKQKSQQHGAHTHSSTVKKCIQVNLTVE